MTEPRAQRTLVKSPPELWAEISDVTALAQHLGEFGEIRIVRLDPETTVAWEGDTARGTVELQESGWGTKVTLTAELLTPKTPAPTSDSYPVHAEEELSLVEPEPVAAAPEPEPEPVAAAPEPEPAPRKVGFFARLFGGGRQPEATPTPEPATAALKAEPVRAAEAPAPEPVAEPEPVAVEPEPVAVEPEPVAVEPEPELVVVPKPEPDELRAGEPVADRPLDHDHAVAVLTGVLDDLGSARHRPFSR
jgi:hypothetical protein